MKLLKPLSRIGICLTALVCIRTAADAVATADPRSVTNNGVTISPARSSPSGAITLDAPTINVSGPVSLTDTIKITPSPCCIAELYIWDFNPITTPSLGVISVTQPGLQLHLANLGLQLGTYELRVHASSGTETSPDAIKTITVVSSSLSGLRVFPNPWRSDRDQNVDVTFDHLTPGAKVKIFDMAARWVRTLDASSDSVTWNRRNDKGDVVASGLYLYVITDNQDGKARGKLTLIK